MSVLPTSLSELKKLDVRSLFKVHNQGRCPDLEQFNGSANGTILVPRYMELLRIWRGKVFWKEANGEVRGLNRIGYGPFERRQFAFVARIGQSAFSDRQVLLLDHDQPENPKRIRIFHDEAVEMRPGLYLAHSHLRKGGALKFASFFVIRFD